MSFEIEMKRVTSQMKGEAKKVVAYLVSTRMRATRYLAQEVERGSELAAARQQSGAAIIAVSERMANIESEDDADSVQWLVELSGAIDLLAVADFQAESDLAAVLPEKYLPVRPAEETARSFRLSLAASLARIVAAEIALAANKMQIVLEVITGATKLSDLHAATATISESRLTAVMAEPMAPALPRFTIDNRQTAAEVIAVAEAALKIAHENLKRRPEPVVAPAKPPIHWIRATLNQLQLTKVAGLAQQQAGLIAAATKLAELLPLLTTVVNDVNSGEAIGWLMTFNIVIRQAIETRMAAENFSQSIARPSLIA